MINHCTLTFKLDTEQDFNVILCEYLNYYAEKFKKNPSYVYTHEEIQRPKELKGPKLRFRTGATKGYLMLGCIGDKMKITEGDLIFNSDNKPWTLNGKFEQPHN